MSPEVTGPGPDGVQSGTEVAADDIEQELIEDLKSQRFPDGSMLAVRPPRSVPTGPRVGQGGWYAGGDPTTGEASPELKAHVQAFLEKHLSDS